MSSAAEVIAKLVADGVTEFAATDARLRDQARRTGWSGTLRGPLRFDGGAEPATVADAVGALVPAARVSAERPQGALRGLLRRTISGMGNGASIRVEDASGLPPFVVRFPDRPDFFVESLARIVEVTVSMRTRFGAPLDHVRLVEIDLGPREFATGHAAGMVQHNRYGVHLNAALFVPDGMDFLDARRAERAADPGRTPPAEVPPPWSSIDATMAHELWHQIELIHRNRHFETSIAMRQAIGAHFGEATIEHVVNRGGGSRQQLIDEVSSYASTNALEAMAEMAKLWWCGSDSPAARHFGMVIDEYFPPPPGWVRQSP